MRLTSVYYSAKGDFMSEKSDTTQQSKEGKTVHILITQCLQNGFFLSDSNRLSLPIEVVNRLFLGTYSPPARRQLPTLSKPEPNRRNFHPDDLKEGPLYKFLSTVIDKKKRNSELHVIHLKDWHSLSPRYDEERRLYGGHCEADTWEAEPIEGFEQYLKPWGSDKAKYDAAKSLDGFKYSNKVTFYEVLSDSVFDFKQSKTIKHKQARDVKACLDSSSLSVSHLSLLLDNLIQKNQQDENTQIYVTVIGVYTDIKIKTLLVGLRSRYDLPNLMVSDVLTASPSLERHLEGLDFADKVLNVEIVSDLNTIVGILDKEKRDEKGVSSEEKQIPKALTADSIKWRDYRNYFLDKQTVLSYQDQHLAEYMKLTTKRSTDIYNQVYNLNVWLTWIGRVAIGLLLLLIIWNGFLVNITPLMDRFHLETIPIEVFVATGIGTFAQIIPLFFTKPQEQMQKNLAVLVRLRNYLETYSMTTAILRHHLTTPERLAEGDIEDLHKQMEAIKKAADSLKENFKDISYRPEDTSTSDTTGTPTSAG